MKFLSLFILLLLGATQSFAQRSCEEKRFHEELAFRWAPIHHQDIDSRERDYSLASFLPEVMLMVAQNERNCARGLMGRADLITSVYLDGDDNASNNWENLKRNSGVAVDLTAVGYYSVVETASHWYIIYAFYHPRDWECEGGSSPEGVAAVLDDLESVEHENDMEGLLVIVEKNGTEFGALQGIVTVAHNSFYSFLPAGSSLRASAEEDEDGPLNFSTLAEDGRLHPVTAQEARGHGLKAEPAYAIDGDGIIYEPTLGPAFPPSDPKFTSVELQVAKYRLIDIFDETEGLWNKRCSDFNVFNEVTGLFNGNYGNSEASPPWQWDDTTFELPVVGGIDFVDISGVDDGLPKGIMANHPDLLAQHYFSGFSRDFSHDYIYNPYLETPLSDACNSAIRERFQLKTVDIETTYFYGNDFCVSLGGPVPTPATYGYTVEVKQESYRRGSGASEGLARRVEFDYELSLRVLHDYDGKTCSNCTDQPLADETVLTIEHVRIQRVGDQVELQFLNEEDRLPPAISSNSLLNPNGLIAPYENRTCIQLTITGLDNECRPLVSSVDYNLAVSSYVCPDKLVLPPEMLKPIDILVAPVSQQILVYQNGVLIRQLDNINTNGRLDLRAESFLRNLPQANIKQVTILEEGGIRRRQSATADIESVAQSAVQIFRAVDVVMLNRRTFNQRLQQLRE